jgi:hypothetical protein
MNNPEYSKTPITEIKLTHNSEDLLTEWLYSCKVENVNNGDDRGFYAEFESYRCKPWLPIDVSELIAYGLATAHADSDYIPELDEVINVDYDDIDPDDQENFGGVALLNITEKGMEYVKHFGLYLE